MFGRQRASLPTPGGTAAAPTPNSGILSRVQQQSGAPASAADDDRVSAIEQRVDSMDEKLDSILTALEDKDGAASTDDDTTEPASALPDEESTDDTEPSAASAASSAASAPATIAQLKAALPESDPAFREMCAEQGFTVEQASGVFATMRAGAVAAGAAATLGDNQPFAVSPSASPGGDSAEQRFAAVVAQGAAAIKAAEPGLSDYDAQQRAQAQAVTGNLSLYAEVKRERKARAFAEANGISPSAMAHLAGA